MRCGLGHVRYPSDARRVLMLGGLKVPGAWGLRGPGDGDAVLHAVVDALLGAAALGSRAERFPDDDPRWAEAPSAVQVGAAVELLAEHGLAVENVDVTVLSSRAAWAGQREAVRERLGALLQVEPGRVSVKAQPAPETGAGGTADGATVLAVAACREESA